MPHSDELPESLAGLARRNAIEIRDNSWHYDVGRLVRTLENIDRERIDALEAQSADTEPSPTDAPRPGVGATEPAPAAEQASLSRPAARRFSTTKKLLAVAGAVLTVALLVRGLLVARGSSEPTLEEWRTDADDICRRTNQRLRQLGTFGDDEEANVNLLRRALPITTEATNQLRALDAPFSDTPQIDRFLGLLDDSNQLIQDVIQAWEDDMARAESARLDLVAINEESIVEAADLGAADCAEPAFETP